MESVKQPWDQSAMREVVKTQEGKPGKTCKCILGHITGASSCWRYNAPSVIITSVGGSPNTTHGISRELTDSSSSSWKRLDVTNLHSLFDLTLGSVTHVSTPHGDTVQHAGMDCNVHICCSRWNVLLPLIMSLRHMSYTWRISLIFDFKKKQPGLWTFPSTQGLSGSHSQSVSCSVGNMSSCLLLAFLFSVSLASPHLHCLHSSVSWTLNCARLLIVATPVLKAAVKPTKVKLNGNNVRDIHCTCDKYGHTNKQTN